MSQSVPVDSDGTFVLRSVAPGAHELRVTTTGGKVLHQEIVFLSGPNDHLTIRLRDTSSANRSSEASVSLQQLQHKVPAQAQKAFNKGLNAARKGNREQAAEYFRQAVTIDPEFADGYNELGAAQEALGELPQAAEQFQKAIDVAPEHRLALQNLSIVLAKMKRYKEAGEVARRALKVTSDQPKLRFVLALSLVAEHGDTAEAIDNLQRAATEIPKAHLLAARLLVETGRRQDAAKHLEDYLRAAPPQDTDRPQAEAWLAQLKN
jgi:tetratricopeptide (TPR) repeat protein